MCCMAAMAQCLNCRLSGICFMPLAFRRSMVTFMEAFFVAAAEGGNGLAVELVVGIHDPLHDGMAHHVTGIEPGEAHAADLGQNLGGLHQARARRSGYGHP